MRASVILNTRSSRTQRQLNRLPGLMRSRGIAVDGYHTVEGEDDLRKYVKRAVKAGATLAIVGGGDGSMATAVDVLANEDTVLGVLPLGTGNSFAKTLHIDDDLERALDVIAAGRTRRVDLGVVNGTHFANFATIGLSSEIADAAPHALKPIMGPAAYALGAAGPFLTHRPFTARIRSDRGESTLRTQQIVIANGRFFGRQPVTPDATIVDERLAFFTTTGVSYFAVARMYAAFGLGLQTRLPDAMYFSAKAICVKASPKQLVAIDGNAFGRTPARFSVAPRALHVCVPADFHAYQ